MGRVIGGICIPKHCRMAFRSEDKYCIHFPFVRDMSSTKAVL